MPTFDSGRAASLGGINIRSKRGSDLNGIRFADNRSAAPSSANDMVLYRVSNSLRFWDGTTEYNLLTSVSGSVGDLNGVYENGASVVIDEGPIILTDSTAGALDMLRLTKSGAGSGDSLEFLHTSDPSGRAIYMDMNLAIARTGILIDSGGTARTGSDIQFTDDSTGAHSVIDINSSGSGASIGLDFTGSYSGSPAGSAISITLGNGNNLDTNGILFTGGTGVRTAPVLNIDDAGTGSAAMIDIDLTGAYTGNIFDFATSGIATGNVFFVNLDTAVAMTALHIEGSGARTQPMIELASDSTGALSMVEIILTGAISGHVFEISMDTTSTGDVLNVDMNAAVGGRFLFLDAGGGARTANLIAVTYDATGNLDLCEIADSNTGTGHLFDINVSGIGSGQVLDITYSAADTGDAIQIVMADNVAGGALVVTGAGARTDSLVDITSVETGSVDGIVLIQTATGVFTGHMLTVNSNVAATTGGLLHLDLGLGVAYKGITIDHAGARTVETVLVTFDGTFGSGAGGTFINADITMTGASASPFIDIDVTGVYTGNIIDIVFGNASASTGDAFHADMGTNLAGNAIQIDAAGIRTAPLINIVNTGTDGGTDDHVILISQTGLLDSNVLDIVFSSAASTGHAIHVDMGTDLAGNAILIDAAGVRTAPLIRIANTGTDGGTDDHVISIAQTGLLDSNILDIVYSSAASTGEAIHIDMGTNVAGSALVLDTAGARTDDLIKIDDTSSGNSQIFDINLSGVYTGNVLDVTFATLAATGNAIDLNMGTNVAGMALSINSAGTGVTDEGNAIDIVHSGVLVGGADIVSIAATGAISATSNALYIATIGDAGAYALKINATGSAEAIHVDAGTVTFDESLSVGTTLAVTGATTLSSTLSYRNLTEVVTAANVLTAAESGSVFFLNAGAEFASTLPAPAAGLNFTFIVTAAPSGASYTIVTETSTNIIYGEAVVNGAAVPAVAEDTITLTDGAAAIGDWVSVWCDGTNWYVKGQGVAASAIAFTAT